jgi:REP element-mobilizing transposase RayT
MMPKYCVTKIVQRLQGPSLRKLVMTFSSSNNQYWGRRIWVCGHSSSVSGSIIDEMIAEYISNQGNGQGEDFKIAKMTVAA